MKHKQLTKYLSLTYLISWLCWGMLIILINIGVTTYSSPLGFIIFCAGGFGPTIAAIISLEKRTPKAIAQFIFSGNHKAVPYLLLFCLLLGATIYFSSDGLIPNTPILLFPVYIIMLSAFGGGNEELGWRGIMQPALEKTMPFPFAVLLTGVVWSVWHLPLWFVEGSNQQLFPFAAFAAFAIILSFALAIIYKKTKCVMYCCLFHGYSNTLMSYFMITDYLKIALGSAIIVAVSLFIWYTDKRKNYR